MSQFPPTPFSSILQEINSQTTSQSPDLIEELSLDTLNIFEITPELQLNLEQFPNLIALTLNECSLISLTNFPKLPYLSRLELCDNKLTGSALQNLIPIKTLQSLALGGNLITKIADLSPLKSLENLTDLDLLGCDINEIDNYREKVFEFLPNIMILDNCDREGEDLDIEEDSNNEGPLIGKEPLTKEVIIVDSSDEDSEKNSNKKVKNAEEYFRKEVFKEKVPCKYENLEIFGKKKLRNEGKDEENNDKEQSLKKIKL